MKCWVVIYLDADDHVAGVSTFTFDYIDRDVEAEAARRMPEVGAKSFVVYGSDIERIASADKAFAERAERYAKETP